MRKRLGGSWFLSAMLGGLLCLSLAVNAVQGARVRSLDAQMASQRQREMTDVMEAMANIEINLAKLLLASGAQQSTVLLAETALLAQHAQSGLSRLPLRYETAEGVLRFTGQVGDYAMTLAGQVSGGGMLSSRDEEQIIQMLSACQQLNEHLLDADGALYAQPIAGMPDDEEPGWQDGALAGGALDYPSLIYDGPFSDGRSEGKALGLTGARLTRGQAREAAARYAGTTADRVKDAADSGGTFEAYGFAAQTDDGALSVQVTGQGGHLLWMMPEDAQYDALLSQEECVQRAVVWLADMGFGQMQPCFVQAYDGMVVANFAAVQDGVLLYPDQVKVQISMQSGRVVGAECSQYLTNHTKRTELTPRIDQEQAQSMLSDRLMVSRVQLCVIPEEAGERLCWGFEGTFAGEEYWVFVDAQTGNMAQILRIARTPDGQTAI